MIERETENHSARAPAPIVFTACDLVQAQHEALHAAAASQAAEEGFANHAKIISR